MGKLASLRAMRKAWNGLKAVVIRVNIKDHIAKRKQSVGKLIKRKTKKSFAKNVGLILKHASCNPVHVSKKRNISHRRFLPTQVVSRLIPQCNAVKAFELDLAAENDGFPKYSKNNDDLRKVEMETISSYQNDRHGKEMESSDIDKRAEDFIANFHQQIILQRQRSIGEYHEMLARGISEL